MFNNDWDQILKVVWTSPGFKNFMDMVNKEYENNIVYPPKDYIFNALKLTPYKDVKVVIVGQDPYHGEKEAHGLSFSVQNGIKLPPSLKNIFKELEDDLNIKSPNCGDLTKWAKEGVLLLNSTLTVIKDHPNSHKDLGWSLLTDYIIKVLNLEKIQSFLSYGVILPVAKELITNKHHLIIESTHPSPFSANHGFFGSKPFSKTNEFLTNNHKPPIDWQL